ncbi:hypothetical protein CEXT_258121 [Caerostris extrusa]|uniref:Uncharacterized protein n=1 Tax=Caerostris extrusa TaxID=172846 RepID=A0AAV4P1G0_CAEEX|nr:hypothetical protein CEXT_258121 [Caerostris extrusa]
MAARSSIGRPCCRCPPSPTTPRLAFPSPPRRGPSLLPLPDPHPCSMQTILSRVVCAQTILLPHPPQRFLCLRITLCVCVVCARVQPFPRMLRAGIVLVPNSSPQAKGKCTLFFSILFSASGSVGVGEATSIERGQPPPHIRSKDSFRFENTSGTRTPPTNFGMLLWSENFVKSGCLGGRGVLSRDGDASTETDLHCFDEDEKEEEGFCPSSKY